MTALESLVELDDEDRAALAEIREDIHAKMSRLRDLDPCILDMSFREAALSSRYGHTLADKIELYELAREFGFTDFGLSNFYDFPSVTDQFLDYLIENDIPLDGFLATVAVEPGDGSDAVARSPAVARTEEAGIPNVILLVEIRPCTVELSGRDREEMLRDIDRYIRHYRAQLPPETERRGRIYVRIADIFDAFDDDPAYVVQALKLLGASPIAGILYEDVRGSRFTFESNALVRLMRRYLPPPRKILAHPHSGNGMEDAATVEAVLEGADGVWAGFTPQAAQGGHGSALMFLTNLVRAGNPHVRRLYRLEKLVETARGMWQVHDRHDIEPNQPVVGERAYRYVDRYFEQGDLPCDLDPALIGAEVGYEIMPAWAPTYVIGKRLEELGYEPELYENRTLLHRVRALINETQMEGRHVRFDDPEELAAVVERAREEVGTLPADQRRADDKDVLSLRRG
ncbi:MAG: hypothetical protein OXI64_13465 [Defluviicoccus sp.]|nr:hypothetical protein [Defluviicoccus sp.]